MEADAVGEDWQGGAREEADSGREEAEQRGLVGADALRANVDADSWHQGAQTCASHMYKNIIPYMYCKYL